ncbi:hypothetical protein F5X98DRAFT_386835 [Xylaria grammica]|nr:hypothetical protein F5X98DRAFT_386835 [Xylaria grammica]
MSLAAVIRSAQQWAHFAFEIPLGHPLTPEQQYRRDTGLGISAPSAHRFVDVVRRDWAMVVWLFSLITLLSRALYAIISPESIWDIRYVLAVLCMIYSILAAILTYLAIRDMDHPTRIDLNLMEREPALMHCPICFLDTPSMDFISLHCYPPEDEDRNPDRALHSFHEDCLLLVYNAERNRGEVQHACPTCRRIPLYYERHHGPRPHSFLENSRLVWYIYSFFARRLQLREPFYRGRRPRPHRHDPLLSTASHWVQILIEGLLMHMLLMAALVMLIRLIYLTLILPISWPVWASVVYLPVAFFSIVPLRFVYQHFRMARLPVPVTLFRGVNDIATTFSYFFPGLTGADRDFFNFPLSFLLRIQLPRPFTFLRSIFRHMVLKTLIEIAAGASLLALILLLSSGLYHLAVILFYGPF